MDIISIESSLDDEISLPSTINANQYIKLESSEDEVEKTVSQPDGQILVVKKVLGDGHCILGCFAEHFNEDIGLIIRRLKIEITRDIAYYEFYLI